MVKQIALRHEGKYKVPFRNPRPISLASTKYVTNAFY